MFQKVRPVLKSLWKKLSEGEILKNWRDFIQVEKVILDKPIYQKMIKEDKIFLRKFQILFKGTIRAPKMLEDRQRTPKATRAPCHP